MVPPVPLRLPFRLGPSHSAYEATRQRRAAYAARYEKAWLDRIPTYTGGVSARLSEHAASVGSAGYDDALAELLAVPRLFEELLGPAPTQRTSELENVLREHAGAVKGYAETWHSYLSENNVAARSEALTLRDTSVYLSKKAFHLLAESRSHRRSLDATSRERQAESTDD
jgi:hypothetical protein